MQNGQVLVAVNQPGQPIHHQLGITTDNKGKLGTINRGYVDQAQ